MNTKSHSPQESVPPPLAGGGRGRGRARVSEHAVEGQPAALEVREGAVAPYLPHRHSRAGENPVLVEQLTLDDVLTVIRGVTYKKENARQEPAPGYVPVLRATNIQDGVLNFDDLVYVPQSNVSTDQMLCVGDIVIAASSGSRSVVGKAAPLMQEWRGSFGAFCFGLRPRSGTDPRFIAWFMQTTEYRNRVSELAAGVNINNLRARHIEETPFRRPPLAEQRRIVAELETQLTRLDASVTALKRVQANLKRYRASVLKAACEGRLVPTEAELARAEDRSYESGIDLLRRLKSGGSGTESRKKKKAKNLEEQIQLPEAPEGWAWATVEELAAPTPNSITDGPFGSNLKTEHYVDAGPRVIRLQNIGDGKFVDERAHITEQHFDRLAKHRVFPNDLVIAAMGESPPRSCIVPDWLGPAIVKADCVRFCPNTALSVQYLNYALNAEPTRARTKSIVHGVGRPRLNLGEIRSISLPLPPAAEQHRIVAEVERRIEVIEELEATVATNLQRAERLRQSLLVQAFASRTE